MRRASRLYVVIVLLIVWSGLIAAISYSCAAKRTQERMFFDYSHVLWSHAIATAASYQYNTSGVTEFQTKDLYDDGVLFVYDKMGLYPDLSISVDPSTDSITATSNLTGAQVIDTNIRSAGRSECLVRNLFLCKYLGYQIGETNVVGITGMSKELRLEDTIYSGLQIKQLTHDSVTIIGPECEDYFGIESTSIIENLLDSIIETTD